MRALCCTEAPRQGNQAQPEKHRERIVEDMQSSSCTNVRLDPGV